MYDVKQNGVVENRQNHVTAVGRIHAVVRLWRVVKTFYYLERFVYSTQLLSNSNYIRRRIISVYGIYFTLATKINALALHARDVFTLVTAVK